MNKANHMNSEERFQQPLLQNPGLHCCLLSGGNSRRMGRDKALLAHPEGGTWLERSLKLLAQLQAPITLLSCHKAHLEIASAMELVTAIPEAHPREGPLLALQRLMQIHPEQTLLLCPVDMPYLTIGAINSLLREAKQKPNSLVLAHDGQQLQPLLGVYPSNAAISKNLNQTIESGERSLMAWLKQLPQQAVQLDPAAVRNINHSSENHSIF
ncbi:MAG: molybdenum cofactor guanylyltransferase [Cyanobacteria bacterium]|nr:molybdenum cofactor guanylyltransferase [Cyanobacteriota bacterium]